MATQTSIRGAGRRRGSELGRFTSCGPRRRRGRSGSRHEGLDLARGSHPPAPASMEEEEAGEKRERALCLTTDAISRSGAPIPRVGRRIASNRLPYPHTRELSASPLRGGRPCFLFHFCLSFLYLFLILTKKFRIKKI